MSQTLQSVLCITTNKYLVHVLVVLLHARFSVVGPYTFSIGRHFFSGSSLYRKYYRTSRYDEKFLNVQLQFIRKKKNFAARLVKSGYKRGGTGMGSPSKITIMNSTEILL